jgi:hypothetical protein
VVLLEVLRRLEAVTEALAGLTLTKGLHRVLVCVSLLAMVGVAWGAEGFVAF